MTENTNGLLLRGARFLVIGALSFVVYLAIMWAMVDYAKQPATLAAAVAFCVATLVSYVGNTLWSFEAQIQKRTAWRFLVIVLIGFVANIAMAWGLQKIGMGYAGISIIVFVTVPILNFLGHQFWTFRTDSGIATTEPEI